VTQLNVPMGLRTMAGSLSLLRRLSVWFANLSWFDLALKTAVLALSTAIVWLAWHTGAIFTPFAAIKNLPYGGFIMVAITIYTSFMMLVMIARLILAIAYRPTPSLADADLPTVTVIIPAYNEGPDVAKSIDSIARSNYPHAKLQIIAVDDGSKDDTWYHMEAAAKRHGDIVCAVKMDINGGKRQGLRVGFALAAGDVVVTMDSDSVVEPDALRNLVTPIAVDPRIGAVAGNVKVLNRDAGVLPRMMRASFVLAFDLTRAYQSKIRSVLCTPGAFSAYRRTAVESVLEDWVDQSWCGKPSTIAEDRALSNLILRDGHEVVFQSNAVVWTNVPVTYKQMAKMYMRWERGNLRENLTYATFAYKPFRSRYWWHCNIEWALSCVEMVVPYLLITASLIYGVVNPFFMLQYLAYIVIFSAAMQLYYYAKERDSDGIYGILYSLFWFTCLWWVVPYSIITANNGKWGTRTVSASIMQPSVAGRAEAVAGNLRIAA